MDGIIPEHTILTCMSGAYGVAVAELYVDDYEENPFLYG